jgi:hypothetical protein
MLMVLTAVMFSAAAWADGIDPKVIIQKGGGSTPITLTNPNPTFKAKAQTNQESGTSNCLTSTDACVFEVFQNQTGVTLASLTIAITDLKGFVFTCGDSSQILFFSNCSRSDQNGVTDIFFSGGTGVAPATQQCVPDSLIDSALAHFGKFNCQKIDPDDYKFVGGEFGLLIDATKSENFDGQSVSGQTITSPEPGVGLLVLFGMLALVLLKPVRRTV